MHCEDWERIWNTIITLLCSVWYQSVSWLIIFWTFVLSLKLVKCVDLHLFRSLQLLCLGLFYYGCVLLPQGWVVISRHVRKVFLVLWFVCKQKTFFFLWIDHLLISFDTIDNLFSVEWVFILKFFPPCSRRFMFGAICVSVLILNVLMDLVCFALCSWIDLNLRCLLVVSEVF